MRDFASAVLGIVAWGFIFVLAFGAGPVIAVVEGILGLIALILLFRYLHGTRKERIWKEQLAFAAAQRQRQLEEEQRRLQEDQRVNACWEVVQWFAAHFGYITKEVITNQEVAEWIHSGMTADSLADEMGRRVEQVDGILLGYRIPAFQANVNLTKVDVQLTQEYRDRHTYIVGKSGSGKTNLLRNLIQQDLAAGNGLGVIAPEQEMLTEEILPFIPESRVGDVISHQSG